MAETPKTETERTAAGRPATATEKPAGVRRGGTRTGTEATPFEDVTSGPAASPVDEEHDPHRYEDPTEEDYERARTTGAAKPVPPGAVRYN